MRWCLVKDAGNLSIRRWENGKYKRLPIAQYKRIRDNPEALAELVSRLNYQVDKEERAKETVQFKHAFISPSLIEQYREFLLAQVPTERDAQREFRALIKHTLNYFVGKLSLANPLEWHECHKTKWAEYLKALPLAPATLRGLVQGTNRFAHWLHEKRPSEVPPLKFEPLSKATFKQLEAQYELDGDRIERRFVTAEEWDALKLPAHIEAAATLCYLYGLRRSEALALEARDVRRGYLSVERQLKAIGKPGVLKGRMFRKTPHWFGSPERAAALISKLEPIHPDTFGDDFTEATGGAFTLHDLRHTFITRAVRAQNVRDVMLAVGHANIETTMGYLKDDRSLDDEVWRPI